MLLEHTTLKDLGKVFDVVNTVSTCLSMIDRLAMQTGKQEPERGQGEFQVNTYSLANFLCSSTDSKSKKLQKFSGFSTSIPQYKRNGPVFSLVIPLYALTTILPSGVFSSMTSTPGLTTMGPNSVTAIANGKVSHSGVFGCIWMREIVGLGTVRRKAQRWTDLSLAQIRVGCLYFEILMPGIWMPHTQKDDA